MKTSLLLAAILTASCLAAALPLFAQSAAPAAPAAAAPEPGGPDAAWRNKSLTPDQRAKDLLPRLTLEEKISLLHADGTFTTPGLPRFGIRKMWMSDGPAGVREEIQPTGWNPANRSDDFATALPAAVGLAASFDPDLAKEFGNVIGQEARIRNKNIMLCPGLNIMRTPLNGRNSEYFGEDPYLASRMAVGFINGIQQNGVAACAKHYALNNQEANRSSVNAKADERTMREIYLPAFKAAVTEAHVLSVMTALQPRQRPILLRKRLSPQQGPQERLGLPGPRHDRLGRHPLPPSTPPTTASISKWAPTSPATTPAISSRQAG